MSSPRVVHPFDILAEFGGEERFAPYVDLLLKENDRINLVSRETTRADLFSLIADCLVPFSSQGVLSPPEPSLEILDVGSGGGLPGLALGVAFRSKLTLVERTGKKADYLDRTLRAFSLEGEVIPADFSELIRKSGDSYSDRFSLAALRWVALDKKLLESFSQCLTTGGQLVYYSPLPEELSIDERRWSVDNLEYRFPDDERVRTVSLLCMI